MPDGNGFKLLEELGEINFEVVFVTAYDQFAIKAFKYSALDYLLKPVSPDDIKNVIEKTKLQQKFSNTKNFNLLLNTVKNQDENPDRLVLKSSNQMMIAEVDKIIRLESNDCYTHFYFEDGTTFMVSKTLKEYCELLNPKQFVRIHKTHLVNIKYVKIFQNYGELHQLELNDNTVLPISRRKRDSVNEILNQLLNLPKT
jgi:two-component system, LytTR family, response regulator